MKFMKGSGGESTILSSGLTENMATLKANFAQEASKSTLLAGPIVIPSLTVNGNLNVTTSLDVTTDLDIASGALLNIIG